MMTEYKQAVIKEMQELQKIGALTDHDIVEDTVSRDLSEYEQAGLPVSDAVDLLISRRSFWR